MKDSLERGIEKGLAAFADAWADGHYAEAELQALGASAALNLLADRRGLSSLEDRATLFGGEQ